jgi:hypothetical protein
MRRDCCFWCWVESGGRRELEDDVDVNVDTDVDVDGIQLLAVGNAVDVRAADENADGAAPDESDDAIERIVIVGEDLLLITDEEDDEEVAKERDRCPFEERFTDVPIFSANIFSPTIFPPADTIVPTFRWDAEDAIVGEF